MSDNRFIIGILGKEALGMIGIRNSNQFGKITILLIVYCLVIVSFAVNTVVALDGSGTEADPWRIESLADFDEFAANTSYLFGYTRLETDIHLAGRTYTTAVIAPDFDNSNFYFDGYLPFLGIFDGNDHKIKTSPSMADQVMIIWGYSAVWVKNYYSNTKAK